MKPTVLVVVINRNGIRYILACLDSISQQTYRNFKITVLDNASTDGSPELVRMSFPNVQIIQLSHNLGFAKAANVAIDSAGDRADFVLLVNNDAILGADLIEKLISVALSMERVAIVGPKILDAGRHGIVQDFGITCDRFAFPRGLNSFEADNERFLGVREVFGVSGSVMLIRLSVLREIGSFDPDYFMFMEDVDLCWRTRLCGFTILACGDTFAYHIGGGTAKGGVLRGDTYETTLARTYLRERNALRTILKNYSLRSLSWILPVYSIYLLIESAVLSAFEARVALAYLRAVMWNARNVRRTLMLRALIQRRRTLSDGDMAPLMMKGMGKVMLVARIGIPRFSK